MNKNKWVDLLKIMIGSMLLGFSLNIFFEPYHLVAGGITGLGIVLKELTGRWTGWELPLWMSNILLNVPLFIGAYVLQGRKFILRTGFATLMLSLALYLSKNWGYFGGDLLINTVYGGAMGGVGIGLVLSASATTGGTDLLASILHHFTRHISVTVYLFIVDAVIIVLSILVFGVNLALYAALPAFSGRFLSPRFFFPHRKPLFCIFPDRLQHLVRELHLRLLTFFKRLSFSPAIFRHFLSFLFL